MTVFASESFDQHEQVVFGHDRSSGLRAVIAIHSTQLGPAVGGCRMYDYADEAAALTDVLRLSRGMTYKSALAGLPFGGGKSVIMGDPSSHRTPALLRAMGEFIDSLGGRYVAAEDSGIGVAEVALMAERTAHVSGLPRAGAHGGDPSPSTAYGVYLGIRTAVEQRLGTDSLAGISVAIQGLGNVGFHLAGLLAGAGADVLGADVCDSNQRRAVDAHGIRLVPVQEILAVEVDVLAPCALGAVLNARSIDGLRAGIVAGAANNQLASPAAADHLLDRGILYCPDFVINAGGIIDVFHQRQASGHEATRVHVERIATTLKEILYRADRAGQSPQRVAEALAAGLLLEASAQRQIAAF
ncbi:MAG: Glu/Leu/Phe/Val dehydrogenase dimerization domain-containing protein [Pseudomonadota bacterium]